MQKSRKLQVEEQDKRENYLLGTDCEVAKEEVKAGPLRIKPVQTYNDYLLILQGKIESTAGIELGAAGKKPEGVVVGVPAGPRGEHLPKLGDRVKFYERSVTEPISPRNGFYAGQTLIVIRDSGVLFKMPGEPVEIVDASYPEACE